MRTALSIVFSLLVSTVFAQNACNTYFPFTEGVKLEYSYYDKKDKLESTSEQIIEKLEEDGGNLTADISTKMTDAKGKNTIDGRFTVTCEDGVFKMDVTQMIPAESLAALGGGDAEVEMSGDGFILPNNPEIGSSLPDSDNTITFNTGVLNMNMNISFTDRKVEARETITTPAGTFDCIRFSYNTNTKMTIVKTEFRTVNWYAEGVGTVRSETYTKNGKLNNYMVLTNFEQ